jgi:cobalt-zinc-cadmium efflux system outer membrane protein
MKKTYWIACVLWVATARAQVAPLPETATVTPLTLDTAWRRAEDKSISLIAARAAVIAAEGAAEDTRGLLWNNPELTTDQTRRQSPQPDLTTPRYREWGAGLSQTLEIAGQQGYRREAARQELAAARYAAEAARRDLRAEVERRFVQVLALQARLANEREAVALVESTATFAGKRVAAGEDSRLDANVALIDAGRARNQLASLVDQLLEAKSRLAELLQWPAESLPMPTGELDTPILLPPLAEVLTSARERTLVKSLYARESAAQSRLNLERAARFPDVTVGLGVAREGPEQFREKVTTLTLTVPLPLFKRNAGNVAQARADQMRAQSDREAGEREVEASVRALWQRVQNLQRRVQALRDTVVPALEENQRLSQTALREGELSLAQQVLINRQLLDGRRDLLEAITDLRLSRIALAQAAGDTPDRAR